MVQSEENARFWNADRIGPIEVRRNPVGGIGQLLGERHQRHLARSVRADRIDKLRAGQPGIDETLGQACEIGACPLPALIADVHEEGAVPAAMMAVAHLVDRAHLLRPSARPYRDRRKRAGQLDGVIHEIATHCVGAVRDAVGKPLAARHEQQLRPFDRVGGDDELARWQPGLAAVRPADQDSYDEAIGSHVHAYRDGVRKDAGAGGRRLPQMHGRIVLGLHRAKRNA